MDNYHDEIYDVRQVFKRNCCGVVLSSRGPDDPHVIVTPITEDDGNWFTSSGGMSSFWLPEQIEVLKEAQAWMTVHCDRDETWGWKFR